MSTPRTSAPRVLEARKVTREELTQAALCAIPSYAAASAQRAVGNVDSEISERNEDADLWVVYVDVQDDSTPKASASDDVSARPPSEKDKGMAETGVRKVMVRSSAEEEQVLGSVVGPGGIVPLLRAGAMLETQQRNRSFRSTSSESRGQGGCGGLSSWWMRLWVYTCVALLAGAVMLKVNHGLGKDGWPKATRWTVMLAPLWVLWILGVTMEGRLLRAAVRKEFATHAASVVRDCGAIAALAYGNSGLCGSALVLALRADGVFGSDLDTGVLQSLTVLPAMLWVWLLFGACAAKIVRRFTSTGLEREPLEAWVLALLAPAATASLVIFLGIDRSTDPPAGGWYRVAGPLWAWLALVLGAGAARLREAVRDVDNQALAAALQVGLDAAVWLAVGLWAVWWRESDSESTCWWPVPWAGVWGMRVLAACTVSMLEADKVSNVQVHADGEELYLTWSGQGSRVCGARVPVLFEVELLGAPAPGKTLRVYEGRQPQCRLAARWLGAQEACLGLRVVMHGLLGARAEALCTVVLGARSHAGRKVSLEEGTPKAGHRALSVAAPWPTPMMHHDAGQPALPLTPSSARDPWHVPLILTAAPDPPPPAAPVDNRRTSVMSYLASKIGTAPITESLESPSQRAGSPVARQLKQRGGGTSPSGRQPSGNDHQDVAAQKLRVEVGYFQVDVDSSTH